MVEISCTSTYFIFLEHTFGCFVIVGESLGHNLWDFYHFVRSIGNNIEEVLKRFTYVIGIEIHRDRSRGLLGLS